MNYNEIFDLEKNHKVSIHYLQDKYHLSYKNANHLNIEIKSYQSEETHSDLINIIGELDDKDRYPNKIAYLCDICLSYAEEILNDYLDRSKNNER